MLEIWRRIGRAVFARCVSPIVAGAAAKGMPCWVRGMPGAMDLDMKLFLLLVWQVRIRYSGVEVRKLLDLLRKLWECWRDGMRQCSHSAVASAVSMASAWMACALKNAPAFLQS